MDTFAAILAMLLAAQQAAALAAEAKTEIEPLEPYRYSYTSDAVPPDFSGREIGILALVPGQQLGIAGRTLGRYAERQSL